MVTINDIKQNIEKFENQVLNQYIKSYYSLLISEYSFDDIIDFTEFVTTLKTISDKTICKQFLIKYRSLGKKIEQPFNDEYFYEDDFNNAGYYKALEKNNNLIADLEDIRTTALGIGTNKLKRRLNKLTENDNIALALRLAFEAEDKSVQAKKSFGKYRSKIYDIKREIINQLVQLFKDNNWIFGQKISNVRETSQIIFFEIPNCEQISFHSDVNSYVPEYIPEWDGKINSTFGKLLDCIIKRYPDINK
jgi:hypothetical protein